MDSTDDDDILHNHFWQSEEASAPSLDFEFRHIMLHTAAEFGPQKTFVLGGKKGDEVHAKEDYGSGFSWHHFALTDEISPWQMYTGRVAEGDFGQLIPIHLSAVGNSDEGIEDSVFFREPISTQQLGEKARFNKFLTYMFNLQLALRKGWISQKHYEEWKLEKALHRAMKFNFQDYQRQSDQDYAVFGHDDDYHLSTNLTDMGVSGYFGKISGDDYRADSKMGMADYREESAVIQKSYNRDDSQVLEVNGKKFAVASGRERVLTLEEKIAEAADRRYGKMLPNRRTVLEQNADINEIDPKKKGTITEIGQVTTLASLPMGGTSGYNRIDLDYISRAARRSRKQVYDYFASNSVEKTSDNNQKKIAELANISEKSYMDQVKELMKKSRRRDKVPDFFDPETRSILNWWEDYSVVQNACVSEEGKILLLEKPNKSKWYPVYEYSDSLTVPRNGIILRYERTRNKQITIPHEKLDIDGERLVFAEDFLGNKLPVDLAELERVEKEKLTHPPLGDRKRAKRKYLAKYAKSPAVIMGMPRIHDMLYHVLLDSFAGVWNWVLMKENADRLFNEKVFYEFEHDLKEQAKIDPFLETEADSNTFNKKEVFDICPQVELIMTNEVLGLRNDTRLASSSSNEIVPPWPFGVGNWFFRAMTGSVSKDRITTILWLNCSLSWHLIILYIVFKSDIAM